MRIRVLEDAPFVLGRLRAGGIATVHPYIGRKLIAEGKAEEVVPSAQQPEKAASEKTAAKKARRRKKTTPEKTDEPAEQ